MPARRFSCCFVKHMLYSEFVLEVSFDQYIFQAGAKVSFNSSHGKCVWNCVVCSATGLRRSRKRFANSSEAFTWCLLAVNQQQSYTLLTC